MPPRPPRSGWPHLHYPAALPAPHTPPPLPCHQPSDALAPPFAPIPRAVDGRINNQLGPGDGIVLAVEAVFDSMEVRGGGAGGCRWNGCLIHSRGVEAGPDTLLATHNVDMFNTRL